jgi:hypothetical protein
MNSEYLEQESPERPSTAVAFLGLLGVVLAGLNLVGCESRPQTTASEKGGENEASSASKSTEESSPVVVGPDFDSVSMPEDASAPGRVAGPCHMTVDSPVGDSIEQLVAFQYRDGSLARAATIDDPTKSAEIVQCESVRVGDDAVTFGSHAKPRCQGLLTARTDYPWHQGANAVRYEMKGSISVVNTILLPARNPAYLFGRANVSMGGDVDVEAKNDRVVSLKKSEPESVVLSVEYGEHGVTRVRRTVGGSEPELAAETAWDEHGNLLSVRRIAPDGEESSTRLFYGCWD